jgi:hypothetical protein
MNRNCPQVSDVPMPAADDPVAFAIKLPEPAPSKVIFEYPRQLTPPSALTRELMPVRVTLTMLLVTVNGELLDKTTLSNSRRIVVPEIRMTLVPEPDPDKIQE